mmetsp:Transcript_24071/g.57045  ORF Transcript_24071/g.57045 Transcript_24071/m.57045 type:complete len:190 (-) Transcript_24071:141-710(-)
MKVAVGIFSLTASAAASAPTKNEQSSAVSSESKGASKDRSSRRRGLRNVEGSSAAFEEAERVAAETVDAGVLDVGTTASCPSQCGDLCGCFDGTAGDDVDCIGLTYNMCYPPTLDDNAESGDTAALVPCIAGAEGISAEDECYIAYCIYGCDPDATDDEYNKCVDACYYGEESTETDSTTVPSVLSEKK